jgi:hypothetical protein
MSPKMDSQIPLLNGCVMDVRNNKCEIEIFEYQLSLVFISQASNLELRYNLKISFIRPQYASTNVINIE